MKLLFKCFASDESGAVTVDWVVLTAAAVGLSLAAVASVRVGASDLGQGVQTTLANAQVAPLGCLGFPCLPVTEAVNQACGVGEYSCHGWEFDPTVGAAPGG